MTIHRKSTRRTTHPVALRVNGKAVVNGEGAKLAAAAIGCTQTTGSQAGQGNVRAMLDAIGEGRVLVLLTEISDADHLRDVADKIDKLMIGPNGSAVSVTITATAAALRNAARLREQAQSC